MVAAADLGDRAEVVHSDPALGAGAVRGRGHGVVGRADADQVRPLAKRGRGRRGREPGARPARAGLKAERDPVVTRRQRTVWAVIGSPLTWSEDPPDARRRRRRPTERRSAGRAGSRSPNSEPSRLEARIHAIPEDERHPLDPYPAPRPRGRNRRDARSEAGRQGSGGRTSPSESPQLGRRMANGVGRPAGPRSSSGTWPSPSSAGRPHAQRRDGRARSGARITHAPQAPTPEAPWRRRTRSPFPPAPHEASDR